jgi:two-component system, cell cycle response regulator
MPVVSNDERNLNYDNFIGRLDIELQRAKRYGRVVSVGIISIDGVHDCKDKFPKSFLKDFTQMVLDQARTVDISTTISSEEFALILPETAFNSALAAAERIKVAIAEHVFVDDDTQRRVTCSIGLASYPEHSGDTNELARRALQAAGLAKQKGGNRVCTANDL